MRGLPRNPRELGKLDRADAVEARDRGRDLFVARSWSRYRYRARLAN
jgi:hypothetical protein